MRFLIFLKIGSIDSPFFFFIFPLSTGLTILKRICRRFGIPRWPYKKPSKFYDNGIYHRDSDASREANHPPINGEYPLGAPAYNLGPRSDNAFLKLGPQEFRQNVKAKLPLPPLHPVIRPQPVRPVAKAVNDGCIQRLSVATLQALGLSCNTGNIPAMSTAEGQGHSVDPVADTQDKSLASSCDTTTNGMNILMSAIDVSGQKNDGEEQPISDGALGRSAERSSSDSQEQLLIQLLELLASNPDMLTKLSQLLSEMNSQMNRSVPSNQPPQGPPSPNWNTYPGQQPYHQQPYNSNHHMPPIRALDSRQPNAISRFQNQNILSKILNHTHLPEQLVRSNRFSNAAVPRNVDHGINGKISDAMLLQALNNKMQQMVVPRA